MPFTVKDLTYAKDARDPADWNPEWSRRARGFATYAAVRELGRRGVADLVERCCHHARQLTTGIGNLVDADLAKESANLQALQVQQQLGVQALSIANQAPQTILSLFR